MSHKYHILIPKIQTGEACRTFLPHDPIQTSNTDLFSPPSSGLHFQQKLQDQQVTDFRYMKDAGNLGV